MSKFLSSQTKPLSIARKIAYTLVLLLLAYAGGILGIIIGGLGIIWVWIQPPKAKNQ